MKRTAGDRMRAILSALTNNRFIAVGVGAFVTMVIQSSSAFTGILIVLATQGLLTLEAGIPLLFGANVGTCITAILASLNTGREARRVALAHTLFKIFGVLLFLFWIPLFAELVRWISPKGSQELTGLAYLAEVVPRQIANAHTIFNVALTVIVLPFTNFAANWIVRLFPDVVEEKKEKYKARFLDPSLISTPALALSLAKAEVIHMGELARSMVESIIKPFIQRDSEILHSLDDIEEEVNFLEDKISDFLAKISRQDVAEDQVDEAFQMMYTVTELEQIADIVAKNLHPRAREWLAGNYQFSKAGQEEILEYHARTLKQIDRAIKAFTESDLKTAKKMKRKFKKYRSKEEALRRTHYERLRKEIPETVQTSEFHQDIMEQFRRIAGHATNIARILLEWTEERADLKQAA